MTKLLTERQVAEHLVITRVERFQHTENCAAAIIPYAGGVIAFGNREALLDMLKHAGDDDGGR